MSLPSLNTFVKMDIIATVLERFFHGASASMQDVEKSFDDWQEGKSNYKYHEPNHSVMEDNRNSPLPATDKGEFLRDGVTSVNDSDYSAGVIADLTKTKLSQLKQDYIQNSKPFFLGVGFYKPHHLLPLRKITGTYMIQILTSIYLITTVLKECHRELIFRRSLRR